MYHATKIRDGRARSDAPSVQDRPTRHRPAEQADWRDWVAALGPLPKPTLQAFVDLGMTDDEIARYHRIPPTCIPKMRRMWDIHCTC
ncbi:hypothetical protein ILP92_13245 [Maribius pontilimi]|uniref:Uncharacterized protein n=1 Tax=Palleronia pontilimi TaxID=1964209 RepID=A0A934IG13_9RHOB|nr:hypothetical protein [Palleronia pontilimi]MBJ3763717.1 hypothetical protein [Palleronia pontilimi]